MKANRSEIKQSISRLSKQAAFDVLRKNGKRWVAKGMTLLVVETDDETAPPYTLAVTASKKTAKKAVIRNIMRRRLKAAAMDVLSGQVYSPKKLHLMILARHDTASRPYEDLKGDIRWCLKKLGYGA
jgi:ribonuclease P protein component